jgi:hypothetical protein
MVARGEGRTIGHALIRAYEDFRLSIPGAKGWHAQLRALTASLPGYEALARAGLSVTPRTLLAWLSDARDPSAANRRIISNAYLLRGKRGQAEARFQAAEALISGLIETEAGRPRYRGDGFNAPLSIDHGNGDWDAYGGRLLAELRSWRPDPQKVMDYYIEDVILEDLSFSTLSFPGNHYEIEII